VNSIKYLIIPGDNTAFDAMRAGKIDIIPSLSFKQAQAMQKTNPEILQIGNPTMQAITIQSRIDKIPFNDIRVRKAMQMAIDLPAIAKDYYHGIVEPYPSSVLSSYFSKSMKGWGFPYEEWPQDLKDEYDYNPAAARKLLKDAGYPHGLKTNIVIDTSADMELFQIVKGYFTDIGIEMEERPMESTACTALMEARKHDQLVYRPYGPLGHTYAPFQAITRLHTRNASNWTMVSDPFIDALYPEAVATTSENKLKKIMRDMNEYVARQHFAVSLLKPMEYSLYQPWLKGYTGQIHSVWMGIGGPSRLSLYGARFWIDQKLKKRMGH
jgi:peptide/nickel transport system substrate-binding protein